MSSRDEAFLFYCGGEELVGIISAPRSDARTTGVLVVVGGPQYRVGSHRQFVLLARYLARRGIPTMRFDYRGMGDARGDQRDFEQVDEDIRAAVDAFFRHLPGLRRVVLWGLCDGATASSFYAARDERICGAVLLNPWVKTAAGEARTYLKYYYLRRLGNVAFWKKLLGGDVDVGQSLSNFLKTARSANMQEQGKGEAASLPVRMSESLAAANLQFLVVLSARDYVAREFEEQLRAIGMWPALSAVAEIERFAAADHTFSAAALRDSVAQLCYEWITKNTGDFSGEKED